MANDVKPILIMGYSRSTKALVSLLAKNHLVVVSDKVEHTDQIDHVCFIKEEDIILEGNAYQYVVKSPGIPYHHPIVKQLLEKQIPIYTEIEIAYRMAKNFNYIAITGTNGKTTATSLTHHLLSQKEDTIIAGNIGIALSEYVSDEKKNVVLELSNFQLLGIEQFKPHIATILNLTPDHLDYMLDVEKYYQSKTLIYKNQTKQDYFLLNIDDENVLKYCVDIPATVITFSTKEKADVYVENQCIYYKDEIIASLALFQLKGEHNVQNAIVGVMSAYLTGLTRLEIEEGLKTFKAIKHRLQFIKTMNGVDYYNDSKATNPEACETALKSFDVERKIILLAGGYDKKISFEILKQYDKKIKQVFAFGEVKQQFKAIFSNVKVVDDLASALKQATEIAETGDIILLSPACASYDQFQSFEHRGDYFISLVEQIV